MLEVNVIGIILIYILESAVAQWWSFGLRSERSGVRNLPPPCCVLEQDTLHPENIGNTQEAVAPSRHDGKIVDLDVKPQHKKQQKKTMCIGVLRVFSVTILELYT